MTVTVEGLECPGQDKKEDDGHWWRVQSARDRLKKRMMVTVESSECPGQVKKEYDGHCGRLRVHGIGQKRG